MRTKFAIIVEWGPSNYSAYAPDIPGCIATGRTVEDTVSSMREAIEFHIEGLRDMGEPIPKSTSLCEYVEVDVPTPAVTAPPPR